MRSEGVGAALLEPTAEAVGDAPVLWQLPGSSVRSDGKSASLTAPNGEAQVGMLREALRLSGLEAGEVQTTECHGTGTALGDPIETTAIREVFLSSQEGWHALGGIKASVGHMEPSAGMVGLLKLKLTLGSVVAPNAQLRALNPHVCASLEGTGCGLPMQPSRTERSLSLIHI